MTRRFVNLVMESGGFDSRVRSLHRLDAAKLLFYRSTADAEAAAAHAKEEVNNGGGGGRRRKSPRIGTLRRLPPPTTRFERFFPPTQREVDDVFALVLSPLAGGEEDDDDRILHASFQGHAVLHDAGGGSGAATALPSLPRAKGRYSPIFISTAGAGRRLYAMSDCRGGPAFHALDLTQHPHYNKWEPLPVPPLTSTSAVTSSAVVDGGRTIAVSTKSKGTYCFDTTSHEWRQAGDGDWAWPFHGRAEYVPELDAWVGFSPTGYVCASPDLSAAMAAHRAPAAQHLWADDLHPAIEETKETLELKRGAFRGTVLTSRKVWRIVRNLGLINLGGGRFCMANVFRVEHEIRVDFSFEDGTTMEDGILLTGVEVVRGGEEEGEGQFRMVKHKSKRYMFSGDRIQCAL